MGDSNGFSKLLLLGTILLLQVWCSTNSTIIVLCCGMRRQCTDFIPGHRSRDLSGVRVLTCKINNVYNRPRGFYRSQSHCNDFVFRRFTIRLWFMDNKPNKRAGFYYSHFVLKQRHAAVYVYITISYYTEWSTI